MIYRTSFFCSLALSLSLSPNTCWAGDVALADRLFGEAKGLMEAGEFEKACPKLAQSLKEEAATGTLIALSLCQGQAVGANPCADRTSVTISSIISVSR